MDFTFAELVRSYRERASLDQAALAAALGVHRNTIGVWERGLYRPRSREQVLRLAEELALTPSETDQLLGAADFPPAHAPVNQLVAHHQLRPPVADFVGREVETGRLVAALRAAAAQPGGALIGGVHGMGGIGKTELAYQVAQRLRDAFPDAQLVLDMHGSSTAPLTATQALRQVIHTFAPDAQLPTELHALQQRYLSVLHGRRALILADDVYDAAQARPLIPPEGCALLLTSRQRFSLPGMIAIHLEQLSQDEAVSLLCRLCARLSGVEAQEIARACEQLPLALRVSGGILHNTPALSVAAYRARLTDAQLRLAQLRDPDDPQLDVDASLALSYALLDAGAQRVFRQLGVLVGDFATALALAVVEAPAGVDVEQTLYLLLRRNLVMYDAQRARWRLHDLVRALALHRLELAGEGEPASWRYAGAAVQLGRETQEQYRAGGASVAAALARFDGERRHIATARAWAAAQAGTPDGDRLIVEEALATLLIGDLRFDKQSERIPQMECARAAVQRLGDRHGEGVILNNLGLTYWSLGEARQAISYYEQRLVIVREIGDRQGQGRSLNNLGMVYADLGDTRRAIECYVQALAQARPIGDQVCEGMALINLGAGHADLGETRQAIAAYEQALIIVRTLGDWRGEGITLNSLALGYGDLGEARRSLTYAEQALAITRKLGDQYNESISLLSVGRAYLDLGDTARAAAGCMRAATIAREIGNRRGEGYALSILGRVYAAQGTPVEAADAFEQALAILREVGDHWGAAECGWYFGLFLVGQGQREQALPLLRASVAYEQQIGHAKAAAHAALLAELEAGEALLIELPQRRHQALPPQ